MIKFMAGALAAAVLVGTLAVPADAQINPFKRSGFELSQQDIEMLAAAGQKLYLDESVPAGTVETWANPASGNSGAVQLLGSFEHKGMPCRRLQHDIKIKDVRDPFRYIFDRCKTASGEWKQL